MNGNFLKSAAFAAMMSLAACTNEVIVYPGDNNLALEGDVIRISLSNTATRAARPIGSSAAENNVDRIAFKFIAQNTYELTDPQLLGVIDPTTREVSEDYVANGNVLTLDPDYTGGEIWIQFENMVPGTYKIIAYAYNSEGNEAFPYVITNGNDYSLKCENVMTPDNVVTVALEEIFAGYNDGAFVTVNKFGRFTNAPNIVLKRQVAALMAYFKDVPAYVNESKVHTITVSAAALPTGFFFPATTTFNGLPSGGDQSWHGDDYIHYLTFDVEDNATNNSHLVPGDTYKFEGEEYSWLYANETAPIEDLQCISNTLFGSRFLLSFPAYVDSDILLRGKYGENNNAATLNICYWDESGKLIKAVPLRDKRDGENEYDYCIECNNFYSIGTKEAVGDTGDDDPISIEEPSGFEYVTVQIDSNWDDTHGLVK